MRESFERSVRSLDAIVALTDRFFEAERIDPGHRFAVDLAIEELFTNLVKHQPDGAGGILVSLERNGDRLTIEIRDFDVDRFDPTTIEEVDVDRPIEQIEPGGLGLHLVRRFMDGIRYRYRNRTSTITLTKNL